MKKEKIYAFIDSQNLNLSIQDIGWKLDFKRFRVFLQHKYKVNKVFLFIGYLKQNRALYQYLRSVGYEIVFKPTVKVGVGVKTKGNCDAELVLHAAKIEFDNYDKAIIVSGDGDFYCLIDFLEKAKKLFKLGIPNRKKYSSLLIKFHSYFFYFNNLNKKLSVTQKDPKGVFLKE